jgi:hypothetical protein
VGLTETPTPLNIGILPGVKTAFPSENVAVTEVLVPTGISVDPATKVRTFGGDKTSIPNALEVETPTELVTLRV